jgi:hypothetical protein
MQIQPLHGHKNDIRWAGATICWNDKRQGWVLPGGAITRIEREALEMAKRIADLLASQQVFIRKLAA